MWHIEAHQLIKLRPLVVLGGFLFRKRLPPLWSSILPFTSMRTFNFTLNFQLHCNSTHEPKERKSQSILTKWVSKTPRVSHSNHSRTLKSLMKCYVFGSESKLTCKFHLFFTVRTLSLWSSRYFFLFIYHSFWDKSFSCHWIPVTSWWSLGPQL